MGFVLLFAGAGLLALPGVAWRWGSRMPPAEWARLTAASLVAGAVVVELALLMHAAPTALRAAGVARWASLCQRATGFVVPGGATVGWMMAAVGMLLPLRMLAGVLAVGRAQRGLRVEPWLGQHSHDVHVDLVVLPTEVPLALSVPGQPDQVVISAGLRAVLTPTELAGVLGHEVAHLRHRHHCYLRLAGGLERALGFLAMVAESVSVLRLALERWADEVAVSQQDAISRRDLRDALVAVASAQLAEPTPSLAALNPAETVEERLSALDRPAPRPSGPVRTALYAGGAVLLGLVALALSACGGQAAPS